MVDILARMNGGAENGFVKLVNQDTPEIHSVVLYMNPVLQAQAQATSSATAAQSPMISIIDPSNLLFSVHLSNYRPQVSSTSYEIHTFHKSIQIYKPGGAIGPNLNQFRDCIDVAAKLAMNFNASPTHHDLSDLTKSLLACEVVHNISNDQSIDKALIGKGLPVRVKQTSNPEEVGKFHKIEEALKTKLAVVDAIVDQQKASALARGVNDILLKKGNSYLAVKDDLCQYDSMCVDEVQAVFEGLKQAHQDLLGELS